jgi:hypothetical protein
MTALRDDADIVGPNQRIADALADLAARGNGKLVLAGAVADDLDQIGVAQHRAVAKDALGDADLVIGKLDHQLSRGALHLTQAFGQILADFAFDLADQTAKDIGHQRRFAARIVVLAIDE